MSSEQEIWEAAKAAEGAAWEAAGAAKAAEGAAWDVLTGTESPSAGDEDAWGAAWAVAVGAAREAETLTMVALTAEARVKELEKISNKN